MPKFLAHRSTNLTAEKEVKRARSFSASTFFLPCGFTQALQLYVLARKLHGRSLTMLAFALGIACRPCFGFDDVELRDRPIPEILSQNWRAPAVVLLGIFNIESGLPLRGSAREPSAIPSDTRQASQRACILPDRGPASRSEHENRRYSSTSPSQFPRRAGRARRWRVDGCSLRVRAYHHCAEDRREKIPFVRRAHGHFLHAPGGPATSLQFSWA